MKINIVKLDESFHWCDGIRARVKDGKIYGVYIYRPSKRVRCCEWTPSYELWFIGSEFNYPDGLTQEEQEQLADEIQEADRQVLHETSIIYVHCYMIDTLPTLRKLGRHCFEAAVGKRHLDYFTAVEGYCEEKDAEGNVIGECVEEQVANWCGQVAVGSM